MHVEIHKIMEGRFGQAERFGLMDEVLLSCLVRLQQCAMELKRSEEVNDVLRNRLEHAENQLRDTIGHLNNHKEAVDHLKHALDNEKLRVEELELIQKNKDLEWERKVSEIQALVNTEPEQLAKNLKQMFG